MGPTIFHSLREFVADYGYWAVALALLCENAGIPVPGETTLLLASFLAYSEHRLHLGWIIVVATCAATLGDNLGYAFGHYGGGAPLDCYPKILSDPAGHVATRRRPVCPLRRRRSFLRPLHLRPARFCRTAGRRPAHALAGVCSLQLPRGGPLGHLHRQR